MDFSDPIRPWQRLGSKFLGDFRVFSLRSDHMRSPRNGVTHDFVVIEAAPWVNVLALTPDQQLIVIRQYRHGTESVELEIPGGVMDPEDASPIAAGIRELCEETGYVGENARIIGEVHANPAIMNNQCYTVLIDHCELREQTRLDETEDLSTGCVPLAELPAMVRAGRFKHSLVVAALYYLDLHLRR